MENNLPENKLPNSVVVYMVVSIIVIGVLIGLLVKCRKTTRDNFCVCSNSGGPRNKVCGKDHNGDLTETSDFAKLQKEAGGPFWSKISPGDYSYPPSGQFCAKEKNML